MQTYYLGYDPATNVAYVYPTNTLPSTLTKLGTFGLDPADLTQTIYHKVQTALYKVGIFNMGEVRILRETDTLILLDKVAPSFTTPLTFNVESGKDYVLNYGLSEPATVEKVEGLDSEFYLLDPMKKTLTFMAQDSLKPKSEASSNEYKIELVLTDYSGNARHVLITGTVLAALKPERIIRDQAELTLAIAGVTGGEVFKLAYNTTPYTISKDNVAPASPIFIYSQDANNPAVISKVCKAGAGGGALTNWKNVTFDGVIFDRTSIPYATNPDYVPNIHLDKPTNVQILNSTFRGRATERWPGNTNPNNVLKGEMGLRLISPKNCVIDNNAASGYSFWLQATGDDQQTNKCTRNRVRLGQMDYIQIIGGGGYAWDISLNDLSFFLGSVNEYQTDSGNHDDPIQISTNGSATGFDKITIEKNFIDGGGKDTPQGLFAKDEGQKGIRDLIIRDNAIRVSQANGLSVNANNGPGIKVTVENNLTLWSAVPHDPVDPQIANAKPNVSLINGCTGTCTGNITNSVYLAGSTVTASGNVIIDYTNTASSTYAENLFPGSLAVGVDKYRIREARLNASYQPGPSILKRVLTLLNNRLAGGTAGQSNAEYWARDSRIEAQTKLNSLTTLPATSWTIINGATEGSALLEINKPSRATYYWYDDVLKTTGPRYDVWTASVDTAIANGRDYKFVIWNQGEGDAYFIGASDAQADRYFEALKALFAIMRTKVAGLRIFIAPMNRRDGDVSAITEPYVKGFEKLRDWHAAYCAANPSFMTLLPEMYDQIGDGSAHSLDAGYDVDADRWMRKVAKVLGYTVTGGVDGPRLTAASRTGKTITYEFTHDGGTGLLPVNGANGLYYFVNGVSQALSNVTVTDARHVTATIANIPANGATEIAEFGYGIMGGVDYTKVLRDNQTPALAVRHGKVTPTINSETPVYSDVPDSWTNMVSYVEAGDASGQTMANRVASPADSTAKADWDRRFGSSTSASTDDPTIVAANGAGKPAHLLNDGGDNIQTVTPVALGRMMASGQRFTLFQLLKAPTAWNAIYYPIGCGGNAAATPGMQFRKLTTGATRVASADGSATGQFDTPAVLMPVAAAAGDYKPILYVLDWDPSTRTLTERVNSSAATATVSGAAANLKTTNADATRATTSFQGGSTGLGADGVGLICEGIRLGGVTDQMVSDLRDRLQVRLGVSIY